MLVVDLKDQTGITPPLPPPDEDLTLREQQAEIPPNPQPPVAKEAESAEPSTNNGHSHDHVGPSVKMARVVDQDDGFGLEYDNTLGKKNVMRLEASSYEQALREAKSFLEIDSDGHDAHGVIWDIE